jgi:hypothetical protein
MKAYRWHKRVTVIAVGTSMLAAVSTGALAASSGSNAPPRPAGATPLPTASELLAKYAQTQDRLTASFILQEECAAQVSVSTKGRPEYQKGRIYKESSKREMRFDGTRYFSYEKKWGDTPSPFGPSTEAQASLGYRLRDERAYYDYGYAPRNPKTRRQLGSLTLQLGPPSSSGVLKSGSPEIRGIFWGTYERLDRELANAPSLAVLPQMQVVNGSLCHVISGKANDSEYTLWIDPNHDFNLARVVIKRAYWSINPPQRYNPPLEPGSSQLELKNVRFGKAGGVWAPFEADYWYTHSTRGGDYVSESRHTKIASYILNPDHDRLGSFKPDFIPNGAEVFYVAKPGRGASYTPATWRDGKAVDARGKVVFDSGQKFADPVSTIPASRK